MIKVNLSRIMGEKRINVAELSRMTGLHRNGIAKLYNEETDGVKFETLDKLCEVLECSVADILEHRGPLKLAPNEKGQEMIDRVKEKEEKDRAE